MPNKPNPQSEDPQANEQLRSDRDDALGYSREQFTFEKPKSPRAKKKNAKSKRRKAK